MRGETGDEQMRALRITLVSLLVIGLSTSAFAGDLRASAAQTAQQPPQAESKPMPKAYQWIGTGMFVGGMTVGLYAFVHNKNGQFPGQDEYYATNRGLGAAGLLTAFAGGTVLFLGKRRASHSPVLTFDPGRVTVSKQLSW
jgi:hypothetical protein